MINSIYRPLSQEQVLNDQTAKEMAEANDLIEQLKSSKGMSPDPWGILIVTIVSFNLLF
jgi:hypothetical protein